MKTTRKMLTEMSSKKPTNNENYRLQHKQEYWAASVGLMVTWNLILTAALLAVTKMETGYVLLLTVLTLVLAGISRKWVLKTPEEMLQAEDKRNE